MNTMVSARVPSELCEQVNEMLRDRGATTTQLINGAYRQFRDTGMLPGQECQIASGVRVLSRQQAEELAKSIRETTQRVPESYFAGASYAEILERELSAGYEALA